MKFSTWTKVNGDLKFRVALYYGSDIDDLLNVGQYIKTES